jgi:predicted lipoprotein with Yx(FWY)xxD motif
MHARKLLTTALIGILSWAAIAEAATKSLAGTAAMATPPGITLQQARLTTPGAQPAGGGGMRQGPPPVPVYADAKGMTLYTFDKDTVPGKSACSGECATAWPPLIAPAGAVARGAWSIITRDDGAKQWAFAGKPLYTFAKDTALGEAKGNKLADVWHVAVFEPTRGIALPEDIKIEELVNAPGQALVTARGMTLYTLAGETAARADCTGACTDTWTPLAAPQLALSTGDFSVVSRADGLRQWVYQNKPLYTFSGDSELGDVKGEGVDKKWHVALIARYFMPGDVVIKINPRHGAMLATASGMTLYARDANRYTGGGASHADRSVARGNPATGRAIGLTGCEGACTETWVPFTAPAEAQSSGYWQILARADGTRQWSYLGFPLYTYRGDAPGSARGHDLYDLDGKVPSSDPPQTAGAQALYWRVALP